MASTAGLTEVVLYDTLVNYLVSMARTVEGAMNRALDAIVSLESPRTSVLPGEVFLLEPRINEMEIVIDEHAIRLLRRGSFSDDEMRLIVAALKITNDLERIGDLVMSVAMRAQARTSKMAASDVRQLVEMSSVLREMLDLVHQGFSTLDLECARKVLQMDKEIDRVCHTLFQKHLAETVAQGDTAGFDVLLMAQALERAGDHTTNLAEDLYSLIEGRSLRHLPKKKAAG